MAAHVLMSDDWRETGRVSSGKEDQWETFRSVNLKCPDFRQCLKDDLTGGIKAIFKDYMFKHELISSADPWRIKWTLIERSSTRSTKESPGWYQFHTLLKQFLVYNILFSRLRANHCPSVPVISGLKCKQSDFGTSCQSQLEVNSKKLSLKLMYSLFPSSWLLYQVAAGRQTRVSSGKEDWRESVKWTDSIFNTTAREATWLRLSELTVDSMVIC